MKSEFGEMRDVIVTPDMLNRYFFMNKTEILVHLFLLSVCDKKRHIKRNVRALARETKRWHADVYSAITGLTLRKMIEEKWLKTKSGRYWRVYPLPRTREDKSKKEKAPQNSQLKPNVVKEAANPDILGTGGELKDSTAVNQQTMPDNLIIASERKGFYTFHQEKVPTAVGAVGR